MSVSVLRNFPHSEPRSLLAGVLAVLVHLVFVALMIFGLNWKDHPPEGMVVDIWTELPKPVQEPVKTQPPPKQSKPVQEPVKPRPEPEPEPPKPEPPKPEPTKSEPPKPAPQKAATPPIKKPDIAMKERPEPIKEAKPDVEEQKKKEQEKIKEQDRLKELEKQKELEKKDRKSVV